MGVIPEPSDDLLAKAAQVLRVADLFGPAAAPTDPLVMVTVDGPLGRKFLRVPLDVPMRQLAAGLGAEVGAPVVAGVTVHGERIAPSRTLGEVGVRAGSVIAISSPDALPARRDSLGTSSTTSPARPPPERQRRDPPQRDRPRRLPRRRFGSLGAIGALIGLSIFVGGAVLGRLWSGPGGTPAASQAAARHAAMAWLAGKNMTVRFSSGRAGVARDGEPIAASLEPVGFSTARGVTDGLFVADPTHGSPFGLSVVISNGGLAYPPSITGLPFATSVPPGREPLVPEGGRIVVPSLTAAAQTWAKMTFPVAGLTSLSLTLAGKVKILDQWKPGAGPSMVARISVPLAAALPGGSTRFTSVYDVMFTSAGSATGWAPADYKIGGNS